MWSSLPRQLLRVLLYKEKFYEGSFQDIPKYVYK